MRRKKNREVNIFGASALDLFASGMGVFLLIAIIIFPYYLKIDPDLIREIGKIKVENKAIADENKKLRNESIPIKELLEKVRALSQLIESLNLEKEDLKLENEKFRNGEINLKELLEKADEFKAKLRELEIENKNLKEENERLEAENQKYIEALKELEALRKEVEVQKYTIDLLKEQLHKIQDEITQKDQRIEELEKENEELKAQQGSGWGGIIRNASRNTVFVVDTSESMKPYQYNVVSSIENNMRGNMHWIKDGINTQVIGYGGTQSVQRVNTRGNISEITQSFHEKLQSLYDSNYNASSYGSSLWYALNQALQYNADTVYLITNSLPTDASTGEILSGITAKNANGTGAEIYTMSFGKEGLSDDLMNFLKALAGYNRGTFMGVYDTQ